MHSVSPVSSYYATVASEQPSSQRIDSLDIMRGFALCGIIFANLMSFTGFYSLTLAQIGQLPLLERFSLFMIDFLIEGKFYRVFAMLLGAGFAIQFARFNQKKRHQKKQGFGQFWRRRMSILLVLGLCHMFFVWHGDILTLYSLLGLCLLLVVNWSNQALLRAAVVLLLLPIGVHFLLALTADQAFWHLASKIVITLKAQLGYAEASLLQLRTSTAAIDVFWGNVFSAIPRPIAYIKTGRPFEVLGQFILGMYLARVYLLNDKPLCPPRTITIAIFVIIGLGLNLIYATIKAVTGSPFSIDALGLVQGVVYHLGAIILALGFMAILYRLSLNAHSIFNPLTARLAVLGRMSLTIYVMQSSVCVLLFYGYGFSLMGQVPFTSILGFATVILFMQIIFAQYWLSHFSQGPLEWLWRRLSKY